MTETILKENKSEVKKQGNFKRSLAGGLIGATVGYLATPENGQKLSSKGVDLGHAVQDSSKKAIDSIKNSASKLFSKEGGNTSDDHETSSNASKLNNAQESSQKNESIADRLERLEGMLAKIVEGKIGKNKGTAEVNNASNELETLSNKGDSQDPGLDNHEEEQQGQSDSKESSTVLQTPLMDDSTDTEQLENGEEDQSKTDDRSSNEEYEDLKVENEQLQARLGKIEELLVKLAEDKNYQSKDSTNVEDDKEEDSSDDGQELDSSKGNDEAASLDDSDEEQGKSDEVSANLAEGKNKTEASGNAQEDEVESEELEENEETEDDGSQEAPEKKELEGKQKTQHSGLETEDEQEDDEENEADKQNQDEDSSEENVEDDELEEGVPNKDQKPNSSNRSDAKSGKAAKQNSEKKNESKKIDKKDKGKTYKVNSKDEETYLLLDGLRRE